MQADRSFAKHPIVYHFLFWIIYFTFNWIRWGSYFDDYHYSFQSNLVEFPLHIVLVYFNIYYLMPHLIPKRIAWYAIILFVSTLAITLIRIVLTYYFVTTDVYKESGFEDLSLFHFKYVSASFIGEIYVVAIGTAIKMTADWIQYKSKTTELQKVNLETELAFLKSQIQPHFFFNTLNNLYSLTLDKSNKAPYTVLKLSELMSYVIYDAKQKKVPLVKEIKHIQNYLDLEMLRYGERLNVDLEISGDIEGKLIPPVLLLPFIENSFKHGTRLIGQDIPILISLSVKAGRLHFVTENNKSPGPIADNGLQTYNHGVGLENTKRRLKLIYNHDYELELIEGEEKYRTYLNIPLDEN
ncbi:histidine kinase [Reichenbachiella carrageenanivorans]|uniref:Histidine kinase n=1 Tax=Reichenbachiella carrageenanivorans TaxID=2979869 RepID=A0ABY6D0D0_9BACT|nr:histidine kinase [Reichenbachiella carrageenanivorans]UXX78523.1 histidine kinase [Reichenbachiella carrageenanivorans]